MIIKLFILAFLIVIALSIVVTLVHKAKASVDNTTANSKAEVQISKYNELISEYESNPQTSSISEDDYYYYCYLADRFVGLYNARKAHSFELTCQLRHIAADDVPGMQRLLSESMIYGDTDADGFDCCKFRELGQRITTRLQEEG